MCSFSARSIVQFVALEKRHMRCNSFHEASSQFLEDIEINEVQNWNLIGSSFFSPMRCFHSQPCHRKRCTQIFVSSYAHVWMLSRHTHSSSTQFEFGFPLKMNRWNRNQYPISQIIGLWRLRWNEGIFYFHAYRDCNSNNNNDNDNGYVEWASRKTTIFCLSSYLS